MAGYRDEKCGVPTERDGRPLKKIVISIPDPPLINDASMFVITINISICGTRLTGRNVNHVMAHLVIYIEVITTYYQNEQISGPTPSGAYSYNHFTTCSISSFSYVYCSQK